MDVIVCAVPRLIILSVNNKRTYFWKKSFLYGKFRDFLTIWWKAPFWLVENQKILKFRGFSSRTGRSRICSCVYHGPAWSCDMYVRMCGNGVPRTRTHRSTCCGLSKNAQKYSSRRIGLRAPLPGGQDRLLPPPKACCQRPIAPAATCRKGGPPAAILLLQARPRYGHSAKLAILHKTRRRGTAAAAGQKIWRLESTKISVGKTVY